MTLKLNTQSMSFLSLIFGELFLTMFRDCRYADWADKLIAVSEFTFLSSNLRRFMMKTRFKLLVVLFSIGTALNVGQQASAVEPFVGEIRMFAGNFAPRGWALCDGQLLPISSNTALFSLLGTTYGGDGRTTFALPDLRGRVPIHAGNGPGMTPRRLGQKAGTETARGYAGEQKAAVAKDGIPVPNVLERHNNMQPYLTINFIVALQGVYPSRN